MHIDNDSELYLNPTGGGGGSSGGSDTHVTQTTTNPVVPEDMKGIADALAAITGGNLGAPVNFGRTGLDAPDQGPLIPQASMGQMFSNPAFQMGANRQNVMGQGRGLPPRPMMARPRSYGDMFSMNGIPVNTGAPMGGSRMA
jgi:hypothetical protein